MSRSQVLWALVKGSYVDLVTYGVPGPLSLSYFVPFVLLPTALLIPPTRLSKRQAIAFFLVPIYGAVIHAWTRMGGVDVISVDALLWSTFLIAYKDPRRNFKRLLIDHDKPPQATPPPQQQREQPYPPNFKERLVWVGTLLASTRLHGWKIGEQSHDKAQANAQTPSRASFVSSLLPSLAFSLAIFPLVIQLAHHDPNIPSLPPPGPPPATITLIHHLLPTPILTPLTCGLYIFCALSTGFLLPAPLAVLTNYLFNTPSTEWSPHALPAYFGPFSAVLDHAVTGLWGTWWHQHMRLMVTFPGRALGEALKSSPFARYAWQVASAFLFSGVVHMGLVPAGAQGAMRLRLHVAGFFWAQAAAVLFEAGVARAWRAAGLAGGRSRGVRLALRVLRLGWAVGWMCFSLRLLVLPAERLRWWLGWRWLMPGLSHWVVPYAT